MTHVRALIAGPVAAPGKAQGPGAGGRQASALRESRTPSQVIPSLLQKAPLAVRSKGSTGDGQSSMSLSALWFPRPCL